jgi:hypothetical protein
LQLVTQRELSRASHHGLEPTLLDLTRGAACYAPRH